MLDPNFTNGTDAWTINSGGSLDVVGGHDGNNAVRVTNTTSSAQTMNLNDKANTVANTVAGTHYSASAWIRVSSPVTVGVREGEWAGPTSKANPQVASTWVADGDWYLLQVDDQAVSTGATIDLNVLGWRLPAGASLDVSEPTLTSSATVAPVPVPPPPPVPGPAPTPVKPSAGTTYTKLAFDDEFDGSTLSSKWNVNHYTLGYELSENVSKDVFLRDGSLIIAAKREATPSGRSWSSGYVDTRGGKFSQQYGYFEARIQIPTTAGDSLGLWPGWWMRPDNGKPGELDIMEAWGEGPNSPRSDYRAGSAQSAILADTSHVDPRKKSTWWTNPGAPRLSAGYHTYAAEKTPTGITFYLDGALVASYTFAGINVPASNFDAPFDLRLQMQVGQAYYWGVPNSFTKSYAEMKVDWVRAWTK